MPGKIKERRFKSLTAKDIGETRYPETTREMPITIVTTRGVTGRDSYGYSPILEGKPRGEA